MRASKRLLQLSVDVAKVEQVRHGAWPMTDADFNLEALHAALDAKRRASALSWRKVAEQIGVSASTLTRMAQGANPDVEGFSKMVRWLGESADEFMLASSKKARPKAEDLRVVVSRHLRASKELSPESAKALESIIDAAYIQMKGMK